LERKGKKNPLKRAPIGKKIPGEGEKTKKKGKIPGKGRGSPNKFGKGENSQKEGSPCKNKEKGLTPWSY